jgi:hypothetical protein
MQEFYRLARKLWRSRALHGLQVFVIQCYHSP